ncbi:MAG: tRNA (adenosine(37)-N6)-threonylcarbamoyltransferase complex ATPase subunit type 1 TsaE [Chitinispirillia bacterium]|nr:tRNA (adenosine(37)-N6)-threonylcarbamoyltransferase complex ATPase subunit type 1 TsaE [Chitinispirillia bacterium]MCL2242707.1 tRNA (adenosine(37)-N6)-threonylcarbamoyltransferase complex ATPase subunit type 1 TsaE [Chitinispirillia bacterium]
MITKVMKVMRERSASVEETRALGARLAKIAEPGDVFSLDGNLGSGKTEFVRGFVEALAAGAGVHSPTFSIVNTYKTPKFPVHHFDFYRLEDPRELASIGFDEYTSGDGVCLIEWGMMFPGRMPGHAKVISFTEVEESARVVEAHFMF